MDKNLVRGSLETIIITLLGDHGEMYGYEITKKVLELSGDKLQLTEGALYPKLHKLEAEGMLEVDTRLVGNRYRKYYRLTKQGEIHKIDLISHMQEYFTSMSQILNIQLG